MSDLTRIEREMISLSRSLDEALSYLRQMASEYAVAEDKYRMAKATSYLEAAGTVDARRAQVDLATSTERVAAHIAEGMKQAALEAVRSRRQQLSALQSLLSAHRAEAEFARTSPTYDEH